MSQLFVLVEDAPFCIWNYYCSLMPWEHLLLSWISMCQIHRAHHNYTSCTEIKNQIKKEQSKESLMVAWQWHVQLQLLHGCCTLWHPRYQNAGVAKLADFQSALIAACLSHEFLLVETSVLQLTSHINTLKNKCSSVSTFTKHHLLTPGKMDNMA